MTDPSSGNPHVESYGNAKFTEDFGSENAYSPDHSAGDAPQRHSTLKKKNSVARQSSVKRTLSRKSRSNSVTSGKSINESYSSPYYTPVPTQLNPTEALANRFQAWRRVLKDFITYFREVQTLQEAQSKNILRLSQTLSSTSHPENFMRSGGLMETNVLLRNFHKEAYSASENARAIEAEIINHLIGLRGDLNLKIKEIKALSGDFKNNVDKEKEATRKSIIQLAESITGMESNPQSVIGKNEPYLMRLQVERQLRQQLIEENYLHKAYINLESSGRELESIVVGEIQKAFESYIRILQQNGQHYGEAANKLATTTIGLPQDHEWSDYVSRDSTFAGTGMSLRALEEIDYPGCKHPTTVEIRSGQLERRTKYLKSYTPGWYVVSPSHLHEFKTPDRVHDITPIMSLYLPDCELGNHSPQMSNSHKFVLKGREIGPMHSRHSWTFRAESHEVMLQWYEDIKRMINFSSEERTAYIQASQHLASGEETGLKEEADETALEYDEADEIPYSVSTYTVDTVPKQPQPIRPEAGRFPSDIQYQRGLARPTSSDSDHSLIVAAAAVSGATFGDSDDHEQAYVMVSKDQPRHHSRSSSAFSYDETHPYTEALESDKQEVIPVMADVPPEVERRMSARHNYAEHETALKNRSSSLSRRPPSRKPTASYGVDPITGQPDPAVNTHLGALDWSQLSHESEGHARSPGSLRRPPSRKPTASYGFDPVTGAPDLGVGLADQSRPVTLSENEPINQSAAPGGPSYAPSIMTLRDIHVPGEYPKSEYPKSEFTKE